MEVIETVIDKHKEFIDYKNDFLSFYKNISHGYNSFKVEKENLELVYIFSDSKDILSSFTAKIDAWYLDGFSPSKNPELWSPEIFSFIKKNSKFDSTFATYTTAKIVKEGLTNIGFNVEKAKGFGNKKEMLQGYIPIRHQKLKDKPWFRIPVFHYESKHAVIIGGGLAGTSLAFRLSEQGYTTTLIEKEDNLSSGASGNPVGMFAPVITVEDSDISDCSLAAFTEFLNFLNKYNPQLSNTFKQTGVVQKIESKQEFDTYKTIISRYSALQEHIHFKENTNDFELEFKQGGWIKPVLLRELYLKLAANSCNVLLSTFVNKIERNDSKWQVFLANGKVIESEIVILCNSFTVNEFLPWLTNPKKVRGQILFYPSNQFPFSLQKVFLYERGYAIPPVDNQVVIGSTFDEFNLSSEFRIEDNIHLLQSFKESFPEAAIDLDKAKSLLGKVGFRAMTSDHLPIIGAVPNIDSFLNNYSDLWKANIYKDYPDGDYLKGLYISSGHGSRGILNSYLAASIISSMITNQTSLMNPNLLEKINPARFLIHELIRNIPNKKSFSQNKAE